MRKQEKPNSEMKVQEQHRRNGIGRLLYGIVIALLIVIFLWAGYHFLRNFLFPRGMRSRKVTAFILEFQACLWTKPLYNTLNVSKTRRKDYRSKIVFPMRKDGMLFLTGHMMNRVPLNGDCRGCAADIRVRSTARE